MTGTDRAEVFGLDAVTVAYPGVGRVIDALSLSVQAGEFVAIVGPNGCGKSTLLRALARLLDCGDGRIVFAGRELRERSAKELARELSLLSQSNSPPEGIRVGELISRGRYPHRRPLQGWTPADEAAVSAAMEATGVAHLAAEELDTLSGGQAQRVWLAMALAQDAHTVLLDEPTTYLDISHQLDALALFRRVNREQGKTIVAVLHDLNQAARYADRIVALRGGRVVLNGPPREVLTAAGVESVFDLPCLVIADPVTGTPLVVPRERD